MVVEFSGVIWHWRGPSPDYFVSLPEQHSGDLKAVSGLASYGWGVIPVHARIGRTAFQTSLIPKDGSYLLPLKDLVRKAEKLAEGDDVSVQLEVRFQT